MALFSVAINFSFNFNFNLSFNLKLKFHSPRPEVTMQHAACGMLCLHWLRVIFINKIVKHRCNLSNSPVYQSILLSLALLPPNVWHPTPFAFCLFWSLQVQKYIESLLQQQPEMALSSGRWRGEWHVATSGASEENRGNGM